MEKFKTTISVSEDTGRILNGLKYDMGVRTLDDVICRLLALSKKK